MELRDKILAKTDRIMEFGPKEYRNTRSGNFINYHNGPIIEFDGNQIGTVFDILNKVKTEKPTRKQLTEYLMTRDVPNKPGIYVADNGTRSSVICTSNVASSIAKIILDGYNATGESDGLSKRVAGSQKMIFTIRSTTNNYYAGARLAGMLDNLKPDKCLSDTKGFYRNYPSYKKGLFEAGNFNSYLIEECLDDGIKPSFMKARDLRFWRGKDYTYNSVISSDEFVKKKEELLSNGLVS